MSDEIEFIDGLMFKEKHQNAPDFVICKLSIKREELIAWLQAKEGEWINGDIKRSKQGKIYAAVDNWKPNQEGGTSSSGSRGGAPQRERPEPSTAAPSQDNFDQDDIPFISRHGSF